MLMFEMNGPRRGGSATVSVCGAIGCAFLFGTFAGCNRDADTRRGGAYLRADDMVVMKIQSEAPTQYMGARVVEVLGDSVRLCPGDSSFSTVKDAVANAIRATPEGPGHAEARVVAIDDIRAREKAGQVEIIKVPAK